MPELKRGLGASLIERVAFGEQDPEDAVDQVMADMGGEMEEPAAETGGLPPNLSQVIDLLAEIRAQVDKDPDMSNADGIRKAVDEMVSKVQELAKMVGEGKLRSKVGAELLAEILGKPVPPDPVEMRMDEFGPMHSAISGDKTVTDPAQDANEGDVNVAAGASVESRRRLEQENGDEEDEDDEDKDEDEAEEARRRSIELFRGDKVFVRGHGECKVKAADGSHVLIETTSGFETLVNRKACKFLGEILGVPADDVQGDEPQDIPELATTDPEEDEEEEVVVDQGSETEVGPAI